jgi:hypothetical protein
MDLNVNVWQLYSHLKEMFGHKYAKLIADILGI